MPPTGARPGAAGDAVFVSLYLHVRKTMRGRAIGDNKGFVVALPHRESFSPNAAYWTGEDPDMDFYDGAPVFAVEVRTKDDYGLAAERDLADKRADYFAAGTQVVWDVDLLDDEVVRVYRATAPDTATVYRRGERAEAEPAVPGWSMLVSDMFIA